MEPQCYAVLFVIIYRWLFIFSYIISTLSVQHKCNLCCCLVTQRQRLTNQLAAPHSNRCLRQLDRITGIHPHHRWIMRIDSAACQLFFDLCPLKKGGSRSPFTLSDRTVGQMMEDSPSPVKPVRDSRTITCYRWLWTWEVFSVLIL